MEKTIIIKVKAEFEPIFKGLFKRLADVLKEDYEIDGYTIEYKEK